MTGAGLLATRRAVSRKPARRPSVSRQLVNLALRTLLILAVAGVIVAGTTAIGYTPLAQYIPSTLLPFGVGGRGPGRPDDVSVSAAAPNSGQAAPPAAQRGRGGSGPVNQAAPNAARGGAGADQQFSGRNLPSLQRGWLEEARYVATFAAIAACVALALRLIRPRRRRQPLTPTPRAASAPNT